MWSIGKFVEFAKIAVLLVVVVVFQGCGPGFESAEDTSAESSLPQFMNSAAAEVIVIRPPTIFTSRTNQSTAELVFEPVSARGNADCFPFLKRPAITERVLTYKRIFRQMIDGVPRTVTLRAYVFTPPAFNPSRNAPLPTIAMFHGGGWAEGTPVLWIPAARYFAARGMMAVVFQYRLQAKHDSTPQQSTADALSAIRWLRLYAKTLGVDTRRIVTTGDSAGGHLALTAATVAKVDGESDGADGVSARPAIAMPLYPVSNLRRVIGNKINPSALSLLDVDPTSTLEANEAVPTLILHGTADWLDITPYADSVAYCARQAQLSDQQCTVVPFSGLGHNFLPFADSSGRGILYPSVLTHLDSFLVQKGWLAGDLPNIYQYAYGAAPHCGYDIQAFQRLETEYRLPSNGAGDLW